MSAGLIAHALGGRKSGNGRAAQCSAHDDHTASLSISEAHEGKVIVRCHAGCERDKVINRLRARGVWPEQRSHWPWLLLRHLGVHGRSDLDCVDRSEAARILGLAPRTLKVRLSGNGPPYHKLGRRVVYRGEGREVRIEFRITRDTSDARLPKSLTGQAGG